jgi:MATE family multidrug resistance protein
VASLVFMVPLGLSTATAVLVGRAYGARDARAINRAAGVGFSVTAVFGALISLAIWPAAGWLILGYTTDPRVIAIGVPALLISCVFYLPDALQVVVASSLRARGDVWLPSFTHFVSYVALMAPLAWILAFPVGWGLSGMIWAIVAASFVSAGLLLGRFAMLAPRGL